MSEGCAKCDSSTAHREVSPPMEWTDYLMEEEGMHPMTGTVTIPLCSDCYPEVAHWKDTWRHSADSTDLFDLSLPDDLEELLAELDTGAFESDTF